MKPKRYEDISYPLHPATATYWLSLMQSYPKDCTEPQITADEAKQKTHPGFTITCDKCGSQRVITDNTVGFSAESGAWGSLDLRCLDCKATSALMRAWE